MLEFLAFLEPEPLHDLGHPISRAEIPHQVIFKAHVETRTAGIALAGATAAELPIDPARFVTFSPDKQQAAPVRAPLPQFNVRAATRHVGRNRNGAGLARPL